MERMIMFLRHCSYPRTAPAFSINKCSCCTGMSPGRIPRIVSRNALPHGDSKKSFSSAEYVAWNSLAVIVRSMLQQAQVLAQWPVLPPQE